MSQTATQTSTGAWPIDRFETPEQMRRLPGLRRPGMEDR